MLAFIIVLIFLLLIDYIIYKKVRAIINRWYKNTIKLVEILNPLEKEQSKNSYIMRILVLSAFWLSIILFSIVFYDLKNTYYYTDYYTYFVMFENYYYTIFIIIGYFVYFFLNIYSKTNIYLRTYDIIFSTFYTLLILFLS
mgnify:CR=1 FL=1